VREQGRQVFVEVEVRAMLRSPGAWAVFAWLPSDISGTGERLGLREVTKDEAWGRGHVMPSGPEICQGVKASRSASAPDGRSRRLRVRVGKSLRQRRC